MVSNMSGATETKIVSAMIGGQEHVGELVKLRHGGPACSKEDLAIALMGHPGEHHKFMLGTIKFCVEDRRAVIAKLDARIQGHLQNNERTLDMELLQTIPDVGKDAADIGSNMYQFPNERHFGLLGGHVPGQQGDRGKEQERQDHPWQQEPPLDLGGTGLGGVEDKGNLLWRKIQKYGRQARQKENYNRTGT